VIVFTYSPTSPLRRVRASGGPVQDALKLPKGQTLILAPRFLPDGNHVLFVTSGAESAIWLGALDGSEPRRVTAFAPGGDSAAEYVEPGWIVRVRQNILTAQRFDVGSASLSGDPIVLAQGVGVDPTGLVGAFSTVTSGSAAASGMIVWRSGGVGRRQLIWMTRSGQKAGTVGEPDDSNLAAPELSPDGRRVAVTRGPMGSRDIWILEGVNAARFTLNPADDTYDVWSPDGARVIFTSNRSGQFDLYQRRADGSGDDELLVHSAATAKRPNSRSPDRRYLLYTALTDNNDLMLLPMAGDRKPYPFLATQFNEEQGAFSPDGKWVAYASNESGRSEIYVRPFPGPGGQWQISTGGGNSPRWRADGKEIYFVAPDLTLMAAPASAQGATFSPGPPVALFQTQMATVANRPQYDVARDGRFLVNTELDANSTEPIHLLLNWRPPAR
jgi:Tol biopolymer transport system component